MSDSSPHKLYQTRIFLIYVHRVCDALSVVGSAIAVDLSSSGTPHLWNEHAMFFCVVLLLTQSLLTCSGCYNSPTFLDIRQQMRALALGLTATVLLATATSALHDFAEFQDGRQLILVLLLAGFGMVAIRLVLHRVIVHLITQGALCERIALVGDGPRAARILNHLRQWPTDEFKVVGLFDDRASRRSSALARYSFQGNSDDLVQVARRHRVDKIIVTLPWTAESRLNALLSKLRTVPCAIALCPANVIWDFGDSDIQRIAGIPLVAIANRQIGAKAELIKWLEDKFIGRFYLS
ncbi:MAG: hypothetical protein JO001_15940 [Alphaproteobacteria bacterium]|nr:hypothetical protein [Alphaproteobacteria bacterium]